MMVVYEIPSSLDGLPGGSRRTDASVYLSGVRVFGTHHCYRHRRHYQPFLSQKTAAVPLFALLLKSGGIVVRLTSGCTVVERGTSSSEAFLSMPGVSFRWQH